MEFGRAYLGEEADAELVARHEREVFPLLRARERFAGVDDFRLYDLVSPAGEVDEDVYAFSNGRGRGAVLVVFNNSERVVRGRIRLSALRVVGRNPDGRRRLAPQTLAASLGLASHAAGHFRFADRRAGREYLRSSSELRRDGLEIELAPYEARVLTGFRAVEGDRETWAATARRIGPGGVADLDLELRASALEPLPSALRDLAGDGALTRLIDDPPASASAQATFEAALGTALREWASAPQRRDRTGERAGPAAPDPAGEPPLGRRLDAVRRLRSRLRRAAANAPGRARLQALLDGPDRAALAAWAISEAVEEIAGSARLESLAPWTLEGALRQALLEVDGLTDADVGWLTRLLRVARRRRWPNARPEPPGPRPFSQLVRRWASDDEILALSGLRIDRDGASISAARLERLVAWRLLFVGLAAAGREAARRPAEADAEEAPGTDAPGVGEPGVDASASLDTAEALAAWEPVLELLERRAPRLARRSIPAPG